jgi:hypothetical protein
MKAALVLMLAFVAGQAPNTAQQQTPKRAPTVPTTPSVQVSLTTVAPEEIRLGQAPDRATVTVQIAHQLVPHGRTETVDLEVGDYSTTPPEKGVDATYTPSVQRVTLSGAAGVVDKTVEVSKPSCPTAVSKCTLVIGASLANPSAGVRIVLPDPATNAQATLTIHNQQPGQGH